MTARASIAFVATFAVAAPAAADAHDGRTPRVDHTLAMEHGGTTMWFLDADRLEYRASAGDDVLAWEAHASVGGDTDKMQVATEGERADDTRARRSELEVAYRRAITAFFDVDLGVRHDFAPDPERSFAVVRFVGLAPYWLHVDAAAFVSDEGELSARVKLDEDLLLTQRLVLMPRIEANFAAQDVAERAIGSGVSDVALGFRLRYEIRRELAPYVGVSWHRSIGDTAQLAHDAGEHTSELAFVGGVKFWF